MNGYKKEYYKESKQNSDYPNENPDEANYITKTKKFRKKSTKKIH